MSKRPKWAEYKIGKNAYGKTKIENMFCFVPVSPKLIPHYNFCRRKMKDACMAWEAAFDEDWVEAVERGWMVMKIYGTGVCKTDQSLQSIDDWVEVVSEGEGAAA